MLPDKDGPGPGGGPRSAAGEDPSVSLFRDYLRLKTVHPQPDYGETPTHTHSDRCHSRPENEFKPMINRLQLFYKTSRIWSDFSYFCFSRFVGLLHSENGILSAFSQINDD